MRYLLFRKGYWTILAIGLKGRLTQLNKQLLLEKLVDMSSHKLRIGDVPMALKAKKKSPKLQGFLSSSLKMLQIESELQILRATEPLLNSTHFDLKG